MKLEKAIEILTENLPQRTTNKATFICDAQKLGIEALKEIIEERKYEGWTGSRLLPGETKE